MLVIAQCPFNDAEAGALRMAGDRFECDEKRARHLAALGLAAVAKEQPETPSEEPPADPPEEPANEKTEEPPEDPIDKPIEEPAEKPAPKAKKKTK